MSDKQYRRNGNQIFYGNEESERLVAVMDEDQNPVFESGMAGAHTRKLAEWLQSPPKIEEDETRHAPEGVRESAAPGDSNVFVGDVPPPVPPLPELPEPASEPASREEWIVSEIPDDRLPPFDKALGVFTPEFQQYVRKNKLDAAQAAALVNRLERR